MWKSENKKDETLSCVWKKRRAKINNKMLPDFANRFEKNNLTNKSTETTSLYI